MTKFEQIGITTDGRPVVRHVFALIGTHGIPLEMVLELMKAKGLVVSWPYYVQDSLADGAKMRTIEARVFSAISEVHGPVYAKAFRERWNEYFDRNA